MQATNRIQNAMINANAGFQAGMVVDSGNAHRVYLTNLPCDTKPVSKCSRQMSMALRRKVMSRLSTRLPLKREEQGRLAITPVTERVISGQWRHSHSHFQMPATVWATFVLNPATSG
jgi:hypothetical protein